MDLAGFGPSRAPTFDEMAEIGKHLLASLSAFLRTELRTFKEHYVEEGSIALTFRSQAALHRPLALMIEGCLLFDVRPDGSPPAIDAEVLLFAAGRRSGPQDHCGNGYLVINYGPRESEYGSVRVTFDRRTD